MYLEQRIAESRHTPVPRWGMCAGGYTERRGAPTCWLVRLEGEKRWRRLKIWQFSNAGTCFVTIKGHNLIVTDSMMP